MHPKCLILEGELRFPPNTPWIAQLFLGFFRKKESHTVVPNPKPAWDGFVPWPSFASSFLGLIPNPSLPELVSFPAGFSQISAQEAQDTGVKLFPGSTIPFPLPQAQSISNLSPALEVFSWNFESIPPFSL